MSHEVPEGWQRVELGQIALPRDGLQTGPFGSQLKASEYSESGTPVVMPSDIIDGKIDVRNISRVPPETASRLEVHKLKAGDIVFARRGDIGRCSLVQGDQVGYVCGTGCLRARLNPALIHPEFGECFFKSVEAVEWLNEHAVGQTMLNLNTSIIAKIPILLPPLDEQRRIAEILSSVDDAVAATRAVIEQTRMIKQSVLERLLTRGIGHTRFKQTVIGEIPEGWEVAALRSLLASSTYGLNTAMEAEPNGIPILRMGNIQDSEISLSGLKYAVLDNDTKTKYNIRRGDILFNRTNSRELVGKVAIAREDLNASFASYLIRLRVNGDHDPFFVHSVLSSPQYQSLLRSISTPGASQANINATKLGNVLLPVPKIEEQREIALTMHGFLVSETANLQAISGLEASKSALMSDLLTGRKRVSDALPMAAE